MASALKQNYEHRGEWFTLKGKWHSESRDPSSSTTGPDWSPDISCMVASRESAAEPSEGCSTLARVSKALLVHKKVTIVLSDARDFVKRHCGTCLRACRGRESSPREPSQKPHGPDTIAQLH